MKKSVFKKQDKSTGFKKLIKNKVGLTYVE